MQCLDDPITIWQLKIEFVPGAGLLAELAISPDCRWLTECNMVAPVCTPGEVNSMRSVMRHWHAKAAPTLGALMEAEDRVLAAANSPALKVCCDELDAAVWSSDKWLHDNPCPDRRFGRVIDELIRACVGIQAILYSNLLADDAHKARAAQMLMDRLAIASKARIEIRQLV
jgi:hypothetical protein